MLRCLPRKYRQALELTEMQGFSQTELAARLNISVSGAKSRVQRAREKLKEALLDCCHFEFDRYGRVIDYHANCAECAGQYPPRDCGDDPGDDK
jgi:RNA polymerase sigma-70 factor (ECF subfamily)